MKEWLNGAVARKGAAVTQREDKSELFVRNAASIDIPVQYLSMPIQHTSNFYDFSAT